MPASAQGTSSSTNVLPPESALIRSLRSRVNWPLIRDFLKDADFKSGTSWAGVEAAVKKGDSSGLDLKQKLEEFYSSVRIAGSKYVQIFDMPTDAYLNAESSLKSAVVAESAFSSTYPYVLPDSSLREAPSDLTLCEVKSDGTDYFLVFCSRRDYTERHTFDESQAAVIGRTLPAFAGFDSFIALRTKSFQAIDVVVIRPKLERIEIMVDIPQSHSGELNKGEQVIKLAIATSNCLPALSEVLKGHEPCNLFSAIALIYKDKRAGLLQGIRFRTTTGLVDYLRTTVATDDLRVARYFEEGAKAIKDLIEPFELTCTFPLTRPSGRVTLLLSSNVRSLAAPPDSRWLRGLELIDCLSPVHAVRGINKVVSFLG